MFRLSPSKLHCYIECPRLFYHRYLDSKTKSIIPPARPYFTMGAHVHHALNLFFELKPAARNQASLLKILDFCWQGSHGPQAGFYSEAEEQEYLSRAQLMLKAFAASEFASSQPFFASEQTLSSLIRPDIQLMGRIDRIDQTAEGLHLIDYKTSKEERDDPYQLPIYAILAHQRFQQPIVRLSYLYLEKMSLSDMPTNPAREQQMIYELGKIVDSMPKSLERQAWICPSETELCPHIEYLRVAGAAV